MSNEIKNKIQKIVNVFESGSPEGDYGCISLYEDGPNGIRQITYGKSQTTEWGNLNALINLYIKNEGDIAEKFEPYKDKIGLRSFVSDKAFIALLKEAAKDPIMQKTQDQFFDIHYWEPAKTWFTKNGFKLNLSMLVIYDSFIHSGSILKFLRNRFSEVTPALGGDEKEWIKAYVQVRHDWLKGHSNKILTKTIYRTQNFLDAIKKDDWDLSQVFVANGTKVG
jgi:chitosanase